METEKVRQEDYQNERKSAASLFPRRKTDEEDSSRLKSDTSSTIVSSSGDTFDEIIRRQVLESEIHNNFQKEEEYSADLDEEYSAELTEGSESENSTWGESYDIYRKKKKIDDRNGNVKFFKDDESLNSLEWIVDPKDGSSSLVSTGEGSLEKLLKLTQLGVIDEGSDSSIAENEDGQLIQTAKGNALTRRLRTAYERIQQYEKFEEAVEKDGYDATQLLTQSQCHEDDGKVTNITKIQLVKVRRQQFVVEEKPPPNLVDKLLVLKKRDNDSPKSNENSHPESPNKREDVSPRKKKYEVTDNYNPISIEQFDIEEGSENISALTPPISPSPKVHAKKHHKNKNQVEVDEEKSIDSSEIPPVQEPQNANASTSFFRSFLNSHLFKSQQKTKARNRIVLSDDATVRSRLQEYQQLECILIVLVIIAVLTLIILIVVFVA